MHFLDEKKTGSERAKKNRRKSFNAFSQEVTELDEGENEIRFEKNHLTTTTTNKSSDLIIYIFNFDIFTVKCL